MLEVIISPLRNISLIFMYKEDLGEIIKRRRKFLGITQKALSEIVSIGLRSLVDIESGKGNPTIETLLRIFEALGLNMEVKVNRR
jgi:y4mF family transcriptional regulator